MRKPVTAPAPVFGDQKRTRLLAAIAKLGSATEADLAQVLDHPSGKVNVERLIALRVVSRVPISHNTFLIRFNTAHPAHAQILRLARAMIPYCTVRAYWGPKRPRDVSPPKEPEDLSGIPPTLFGRDTRSQVLHLLAVLREATAADIVELVPGKRWYMVWWTLRSLERWGMVRIRYDGHNCPASLNPSFPVYREFKAALDRFNEIYPGFKARARFFRRVPRDTESRQ
jgi:hypothetical protein